MKTPHSLARRCVPLTLVALFALLANLHASLLIYEGFDGYTAGDIGGQASNATGLSGNYVASQSNQVFYQTNGLSFSTLQVSGGSIYQKSGLGTNFGAKLDAGTVTGSLFTSYLINFSSAGDTASRAYASIASNSPTDASRFLAALADNSTSTSSAVGYAGVGASAADAGISLAGGVTYMVLAHFTNVGAALSEANPGAATLWVITASQYDYFSANGFTEEALNAAGIGSGASSVFARATDSLTAGTYSFSNSKYLQLSLNSNSSSRTFTMDEVRYGTALSDVTLVPEPSAAALAVLTLAGWALFAGKRRAV